MHNALNIITLQEITTLRSKKYDIQGKDQKQLIERFIRLFGTQALDCLTADREFVGEKWIKYLNDRNIRYYIRIRENFWVLQPHNGKRVKASWLFSNLPLNSCRVNDRIVYVNNQLCYLSGSKVKNKAGKPELQLSPLTIHRIHWKYTKNDGRLKLLSKD